MNVLVVTEPGIDGVFRYVEGLCHYLGAQGVNVHLAYSDRRGSDRLHELVAWVEAHGGRTLNLRISNRPGLSDLRAFAALARLARAVKPDVIHSHSSKGGGLARGLAFLGLGAVQCYHPHAYVGMRPNPGRFDALYNAIEGVLGRVAHTIVVSMDEKFFARSRLWIPAERLHLIPNGVDTAFFSPAAPEEKRRLRTRLGLPTDIPVLGFIGRSSAQKDPCTLYRAFGQVASAHPMALYHVGHGELDAQLEKIADDMGFRSRLFRQSYTSTPLEFYRAVDGFILTSRYEGLSLAALEALAANLPLILSDAPGNRDLLNLPLSHAWHAAPGDVAGFARGIAAWVEHPASNAAINHRWFAQTHFDAGEQWGEVLALYARLLAARTTRPAPAPLSDAGGALRTGFRPR